VNTYRSDSIVFLTIPLVDDNQKILAPSTVSYRITSHKNVEVVALTTLPVIEGETSVTIVVPAIANVLDAGDLRALMTVHVETSEIDLTVGLITHRYIIEASATVVAGTNSYQSLEEGMLTIQEMPDMDSWGFADDRLKKSSMTEAYNRIGMLKFMVDGVVIVGLNELTAIDFDKLSAVFKLALRKAQMSEADIVLGGDPIHKKREEGLMSDSVGESSIMFRPGKPLLMAVSRRSLAYLSGFVTFSSSIGRV